MSTKISDILGKLIHILRILPPCGKWKPLPLLNSWVNRRAESRDRHRSAQLERQRLLADGLPADHLDPRFSRLTLSKPGGSCAAKRQMDCPLCDVRIERGDTVAPVAQHVFAHWQCLAEYKPRGPRAWTAAARALSRLTELRRRVFWAVACPSCGAGVHQACRTEHGGRRHQNHRPRMAAYSRAKRARAQLADGGVLEEMRTLQGRTGSPWERKAFLEHREDVREGVWDEAMEILVNRHGEPILRT